MNEMYIKKFEETESYDQESGPNVSYHMILPKGELSDKVNIGWVKLKGPTWTVPNSHTEWEQCYIVISGKGTLYIGGKPYPIQEKMIVHIPYNTEHYLEVSEGEGMEYIFVNSLL